MNSLREQLTEQIKKTYGAVPEHLWAKFPNYTVFRRKDNRKWFGIIMDVPRNKLGLEGDERVDILNVKLSNPFGVGVFVCRPGYFPGYHISRGNWISILLDGTVPAEDIYERLEESYQTTAPKRPAANARNKNGGTKAL